MLHLLNANIVTILKKCNHTVVGKGKQIFENGFILFKLYIIIFWYKFLFITALTKRLTRYYICTIS